MDVRFQYRVWRTAVDWTVALYLVIPGLIFLIERYIVWWRNEPAFLANVSFTFLLAVIFLFSWAGSLRLYVDPADQLFLLQRSDWMRKYIRIGLWFGWGKQALESLFFLLLLLPILKYKIEMPPFTFFGLWFYIWQAKACLGFIRWRIAVMEQTLIKWLLTGLIFVLGGTVYIMIGYGSAGHPSGFYAGAGVFAGCWILLVWSRNYRKGTILNEIDYEQIQRMKWTSFLLGRSGVIHRPRYWVKKRPLLFPRSNPVFRKRTASNIVAEAVIKSFLRSGRQLLSYCQFVVFCVFALIVTPVWLRWACWILFSVLFALWGRSFWREWRSSNGLFNVWAQSDFKTRTAYQKAVFVLQQIGFLPLSAVMGTVTFGVWGTVLMLPAGWALSYVTVFLFFRLVPHV